MSYVVILISPPTKPVDIYDPNSNDMSYNLGWFPWTFDDKEDAEHVVRDIISQGGNAIIE